MLNNDFMDSQKEYDDLISQYQSKMQELRVAEKRRRDQNVILFLDKKEMLFIINYES